MQPIFQPCWPVEVRWPALADGKQVQVSKHSALVGVALAGLGVMSACTDASSGPIAYCDIARIAIEVSVLDSVSAAPLADGTKGVVRNTSRGTVDSLQHLTSQMLYGGTELGVYDVSLERAGYRPWARSGVVVNQTGSCGEPKPAALVARLQPLP